MTEIKWIKISTNMFEDEKIDFIESLPEADAIIVIWVRLLTMAGKCNAGGYIFLTEDIPYTEDMLAHKFRKPKKVVELALETLHRLKMIEVDKKGIFISNWEKHQNIDKLEKIRKQNRLRAQKYRERLSSVGGYDYLEHYEEVFKRDGGKCVYCGRDEDLCLDHLVPIIQGGDNEIDNIVLSCKSCNSGKSGQLIENTNYTFVNSSTKKQYEKVKSRLKITRDVTQEVTLHHATDIEVDIDKDKEKDSIPYKYIVEYLNKKAGTNYRHTTKKTKSLIKARWKEGFREEHFEIVIDKKVSEWLDDPQMCKYLRPETLFGTKFEGYLNQKYVANKQHKPKTKADLQAESIRKQYQEGF